MKLYDSEQQILAVLWQEGDVAAEYICCVLRQKNGWNRRIIYALIKRCIKKGALQHFAPDGICHALIKKEDVQQVQTGKPINQRFEYHLMPLCSYFHKNVMEERIQAIMKVRIVNNNRILFACLTVCVVTVLFATSAPSALAADILQQVDKTVFSNAQIIQPELIADVEPVQWNTIVYESADILYYENGMPYIHDILTNNTDKTIAETEYSMLAYNKEGAPLALHWNFMNSSEMRSYEYIVHTTREQILPHQTESYQGGWSLYNRDEMDGLLDNHEANQTAYVLFCLKQVVFADGSIWNNPDYENWQNMYAGKEVDMEILQSYYPYEYKIE